MPDQTDEANLLIVDDLPENLLALDAILRSPGIRVHQAESAEQALELLLQHEFALAILDVQMPGMDGFETTRRLKRRTPAVSTMLQSPSYRMH